jgi:hypothetical protein
MAAADGVRLVMDMPSRIVRVQNQLIDVVRAEMKYARLVMIDPDHRMIVLAHDFTPCRLSRLMNL